MFPCLSKELFGVSCPICGFQRSMWALVKGDFQGSWTFYPPLTAVLLYIPIVALYTMYGRRSEAFSRFFRVYSYLLLCFIMVNHIVRVAMA
jgi:hypothetical protein